MENKEKEIKNNIETWTKKYLGSDFCFRKYQEEIIIKNINNVLNNKEIQIIEAPTGSGKSIIAIITAGVLSEFYKKSVYILCSDLYLWSQYSDFIDNNKLNFGKLKGKFGNYICEENGKDIISSRCVVNKISQNILMDNKLSEKEGYNCANYCSYILQKKKALNSSVVLMTYQLWLIYMNLFKDNMIFNYKDVIICDECHNIPNIIQNFCTLSISKKTIIKLEDLLLEYNKKLKKDIDIDDFDSACMQLIENLFNNQNNKEIFNNICELYTKIKEIKKYSNSLNNSFTKKKRYSDKDIKILSLCRFYENLENILYIFIQTIKKSGINYLIRNIHTNKDLTEVLSFNCAKEDLLINEYIFKNAKYKILLSATIGNKEAFEDNIGVKYTKDKKSIISKIPSTFDFSKSPIYYIPTYKMNYTNIENSFKYLEPIVFKILEKIDKRGIIHTGSYENAKKLYKESPIKIKERLLLYENAKEKEELINSKYKKIKNAVLIGPTLIEGIDLPDDYCRFIIIFKIPFPNLKDGLVNAKTRIFPLWYNSTTSNLIIQGIGRGVRNSKDYCTTFILDGCFSSLLNNTIGQYSNEFLNRIKVIQN